MMTAQERQKISFFRGKTVLRLLQSYDLTPEEKRTIEKAIASSKSDAPKMRWIEEADAILLRHKEKRVEHSKPDPVDHEAVKRSIAQIELMKLNRPSPEEIKRRRIYWTIVVALILQIIYWAFMPF